MREKIGVVHLDNALKLRYAYLGVHSLPLFSNRLLAQSSRYATCNGVCGKVYTNKIYSLEPSQKKKSQKIKTKGPYSGNATFF